MIVWIEDPINVITKLFLLGSWNAIVVVIKESNGSSWKIVMLVTWLGIKRRDCSRISFASALQWTFKIVFRLHQTRPKMWTSITNDGWQIKRTKAKTNVKTICYCNVTVSDRAIFGHFWNVTVHCANFQSLWKSNSSRSNGRCIKFHEQYRKYCIFMLASIYRQAKIIFDNVNGCIGFGTGHLHLWLYVPSERFQFIRSNAHIFVDQHKSQLYSNDWHHFLERIHLLWR